MKTFTILLFFFVNLALYGQVGTESIEYYEPFLFSKISQSYVHSIDSIHYDKFHRFSVLEKSDDKDITKAKVSLVTAGWIPDTYNLEIEYYGKHKIKQFLLYKKHNSFTDTLKYVKYDENGLLLREQYKWFLDCGTGNPYNEKRILYSYYPDHKLSEKLVQTKWSDCAQPELSGIWIDHTKYEYEYDDNGRWIEYLKSSNLWKEGNDTILQQLFPLKHIKRVYSAGRLKEEHKEISSYEDSVQVEKYIDDYSYTGDSIFVVTSKWNVDSLQWNKYRRQKMYAHEGKTDVITQTWKGDYWQDINYEYYTYSGFDNYFDFYHKTWDHTGWWLDYYDKYTGTTNNVRKESFLDHNGKLVTIFKYNNDHKLTEKSKYHHWGPSVSKIYELKKYYNSFGNIVGEHEKIYDISSDTIAREYKRKYYWHSEKEDFQHYLPLVDKSNEWNLGFWSQIGDTLSYVKNYGFSTYDITGNGKKYKELLLLNPDSGISPKRTERYYAEENGKIWLNRNNEDLLLFDFTLQKGDTFEVNDDIKLIVDTTFYMTMENGVERKVLQLLCFEEASDIKTTWIEGIGDLGSGLDNNASSCLTGNDRKLVCFHQDGELVYRDSESDYCWTNSNTDHEILKMTIVPNPATDVITITSGGESGEVNIYDISGNLLMKSRNSRIVIRDLKPGMYIVKIQTKSKTVVGKFLKL